MFSVWLDDAAESGDPRIIAHVYSAPLDAALDDPEAWQAANPALGTFRSLPDIEQQSAEAMRMPSAEATFRNLFLNQRVALTSPFMSRSVWESCNSPADYLDGLEVFGGLDLSARTDLTAFVLIGRDTHGTWHIQPHFWTPAKGLSERAHRDRQPYDLWRDQGYLRTTPGASVDFEAVARDIAEIVDGLDVQGIAYDRWRIDQMRTEFTKVGIEAPLIECGQGFKDMSPALDACESEFLNERVRHGGHPVLTMNAAGATVTRDPAGNRKLDKTKATSRIDGLVALCMAFGLASKSIQAVTIPTYQMMFI